MSTPDHKRTPEEVLAAIDASVVDDELDAIARMTREEVRAELRAKGADPDAIRARGAKLAEELIARRKRLSWQAKARADLTKAHAKMAAAPKTPMLPRAELLARIEAARTDARFQAPVTAAFRKRPAEESSDEELRSLLDEIEMLRKLSEP